MKSIKDSIIQLLEEKGSPVALEELMSNFKHDEYNFKSAVDMEASIMTDLMIDGKFINIDDKWDLKEKYTMKEIMKNKRLEMVGLIEDDLEIDDDEEVVIDSEISTDDDEGDIESIDDFLDADFLNEDIDED